MNKSQKLLELIISCADSAFDERFGCAIRDAAAYDRRFGYSGVSVPVLHASVCFLKHSTVTDIPYSFRGALAKRSAFSARNEDEKLVVFPHSPQLDEEIDLLSNGALRKVGLGLDETILQIDNSYVSRNVDRWEDELKLSYGRLHEEITRVAGYSAQFFRDMNAAIAPLSCEEKNKAYGEWELKRMEYLERSVDAFLERANSDRLKEYLQFRAA